MQRIRFLTLAIALAMLSACTPAPAATPAPSPVGASPAGVLASPTSAPSITPVPAATPTAVPPTAAATVTAVVLTPTAVPPTATVAARHPIPPNFPLATFEMMDVDGRWTVTFSADGAYETTLKNGVAARGTFDVVDDRLTLHDVSGSKSCKAAQGDGTYRWLLDGTTFKLTGIEDRCGPRAATLSGSVWTIQR